MPALLLDGPRHRARRGGISQRPGWLAREAFLWRQTALANSARTSAKTRAVGDFDLGANRSAVETVRYAICAGRSTVARSAERFNCSARTNSDGTLTCAGYRPAVYDRKLSARDFA